jgi:histidinol-phosphate aminotransferase
MTDDLELAAPHILALSAYEPGKPEEELRRELGLERIVKLASNENPHGPSPRAIEAVRADPLMLHRYPDPRGHDLRHALASHHGVEADEITLGNGSNELIDLICRVFASRGDHVVYGHPSFPCYRIGSVAQQLEATAVPLREGVHWNVDDLLEAIGTDTKLLFVANPNNPTGTYIAQADLERLVRETPEHVLVVVDEAYVEYVDADDFIEALALRSLRRRMAVLRTFSKAYALAALRVGYVVAPSEAVHHLNRLRAPFNVGTLGQRAALMALNDQAHLQQSVAATVRERQALTEALRADGLTVVPSQANFVLVDVGRSGRAVYDALLQEGVIVRPMAPPLEDCIRVTVGLPEENRVFLDALRRMLKDSRA